MMAKQTHIPNYSTFGAIFFGRLLCFQPVPQLDPTIGPASRHSVAVPTMRPSLTLRSQHAPVTQGPQYGLGETTGEGRGTDRDLAEATYWLDCAGSSGRRIEVIARRLSMTQGNWS